MKIERLRKSHKKQVVIGGLAICVIGGALTFNLTRAKYKLTESIPLVRGTVNYKVPDLRTVALYTANDSGAYIETNNIPTSGYQLNKTKSVCKVYDGTTSVEEAPVDSSITIEYTNGKVNFLGITKRNTRCYLYFDKKEPTGGEYLLSKITVSEEIPSFNKLATTDEGIFKVEDGMYGGTSYYWRGASTTNHLIFANKCWRIVRINGDGSLRLIYNGSIKYENKCTGNEANEEAVIMGSTSSEQYYGTKDGLIGRSSYVGWTYTLNIQRTLSGTNSNAKTQTEKWYNENIGNNTIYESKVTEGKFCNDRNTGRGWTTATTIWSDTGDTFAYAGYYRLKTVHQPILTCNSDDIYILKVGAITADEVAFSGAVQGSQNKSYFMYTGQPYWTMTPLGWQNNVSMVFYVAFEGNLGWANDSSIPANPVGLRPVINLKSDTTFQTGGNGTLNSPYVVN